MNANKPNIISLIIPAYNEEDGIAMVLDNLNFLGENYEIIVVDDGSEDNTAEIVKSYPKVKLTSHMDNLGYGAALKTGIKNSKGDVIVITDADGTYPNEKIPEFVQILKENNLDMVVGARTGRDVKIPMIRKPAKWVISKLANYLSGTKVPDLNSGLRLMKKESVEKFLKILPNGFSFTTTITLAMLTNDYKIQYMPINYFKRSGKSKIRPIKDTLNFIQLIVRTTMYFNPLKFFIPLSIFLVIFAFLVLIGSWALLGKAMDVTFGIMLMTAVIVMAIGMLADIIDKRII